MLSRPPLAPLPVAPGQIRAELGSESEIKCKERARRRSSWLDVCVVTTTLRSHARARTGLALAPCLVCLICSDLCLAWLGFFHWSGLRFFFCLSPNRSIVLSISAHRSGSLIPWPFDRSTLLLVSYFSTLGGNAYAGHGRSETKGNEGRREKRRIQNEARRKGRGPKHEGRTNPGWNLWNEDLWNEPPHPSCSYVLQLW